MRAYRCPEFGAKRQRAERIEEYSNCSFVGLGTLVSYAKATIGLGFSVGVAVGLLGVSNALMWGVAAFLLNYVPFIGAVCGIILVAIASLIQFQNIWYACLAPILYLVLNALESNFITPQILGKWMTLNPVGIFLSLSLIHI